MNLTWGLHPPQGPSATVVHLRPIYGRSNEIP
jgi:hypothetical protein